MTGLNESHEERLDLADAIALLRDQVADARGRISPGSADAAGDDKGVLFSLGEVTLELGVELTRTRQAGGGVRFSVISLSGKKESADKATHKVTVQLRPHLPGGGDLDVSDVE